MRCASPWERYYSRNGSTGYGRACADSVLTIVYSAPGRFTWTVGPSSNPLFKRGTSRTLKAAKAAASRHAARG